MGVLWSSDTERSVPLKVEFVTYVSHQKGACYITQDHRRSTGFGQEAEVGTKESLGRSLY